MVEEPDRSHQLSCEAEKLVWQKEFTSSTITTPSPLWAHRQFHSDASEQPRGETAATSSSSHGNVPPAAPAEESAPKPWNRTGTSQTGTAKLGLARRETRRLVRYQESTLVKPKKAFEQEPWLNSKIPNMVNFTLPTQRIEPHYVTFRSADCIWLFSVCGVGMWIKVKKKKTHR